MKKLILSVILLSLPLCYNPETFYKHIYRFNYLHKPYFEEYNYPEFSV